jgi:hypothetical protein
MHPVRHHSRLHTGEISNDNCTVALTCQPAMNADNNDYEILAYLHGFITIVDDGFLSLFADGMIPCHANARLLYSSTNDVTARRATAAR